MIDHIGIAVKSLDSAAKKWETILGIKADMISEVKSQAVKVAFFGTENGKIELLEPTKNDSPVRKFLDKKGEGVHHIAIRTKNLNSLIDKLRKDNQEIAEPFIGAEGARVTFIHPKYSNGVLIELVEIK